MQYAIKNSNLLTQHHLCCSCEFWDQKFADTITFTGDPVVAIPDVTEIAVGPDDEFVVLATDGLWYAQLSSQQHTRMLLFPYSLSH